jgi:hypothetical protein
LNGSRCPSSASVPIGVDQLLLDELRDVGLERQRGDVGRQAGDDGASLVAGGSGLNLTPLPTGVFVNAGMISS